MPSGENNVIFLELSLRTSLYFNNIKSSRTAPFKLIEPEREGVIIFTLFERLIISFFDLIN